MICHGVFQIFQLYSSFKKILYFLPPLYEIIYYGLRWEKQRVEWGDFESKNTYVLVVLLYPSFTKFTIFF